MKKITDFISGNVSQPLLVLFLLVMPASTNYQLHDYGFGAGGGANLDSSSYGMTGAVGETSSDTRLQGINYNIGAGLTFTRQANVPGAPTLVNESTNYNKLRFTVDPGANPSDTLFAIAVSTDNFASTQYIKNDNTITNTLSISDYQTYTNWGGASGEEVIGLEPNTTYYIKVKAWHGSFTETEFGPTANATTSQPTLTFDIDVSASDQETAAPYQISFNQLTPNTVTTASDKIWIDVSTNGAGGAFVYAYGANGGLVSTANAYSISSLTANLASAGEGMGLQVSTVTQSSGGPLVAQAPFNSGGDSVGGITTAPQTIITSNSLPVTGGRSSILVKAKSSAQTPAANDYAEVITMIASSTF